MVASTKRIDSSGSRYGVVWGGVVRCGAAWDGVVVGVAVVWRWTMATQRGARAPLNGNAFKNSAVDVIRLIKIEIGLCTVPPDVQCPGIGRLARLELHIPGPVAEHQRHWVWVAVHTKPQQKRGRHRHRSVHKSVVVGACAPSANRASPCAPLAPTPTPAFLCLWPTPPQPQSAMRQPPPPPAAPCVPCRGMFPTATAPPPPPPPRPVYHVVACSPPPQPPPLNPLLASP